MSATTITARSASATAPAPSAWVRVGLLGLPAYGLLTFVASIHPQPDPQVDYEGWARFVTTDRYLVSHLLGSALGLILVVLGVIALGIYLAGTRVPRLGPAGALVTALGALVFLPLMGVSAFAAPATGRAYLGGVRNIEQLQRNDAAELALALGLVLVIGLSFVGNVLLGVAVWRSGVLPRAAGALWVVAAVLMYAAGLVVGALVTHDSPPTEPVGALIVAVAGGWIAWSARGAGRQD